jgi:beta-lactamase class A
MKLIARRSEKRFPLCSTYKFLAAAFALARVGRREESLTRRIAYARHKWLAAVV